MVLAAAAPVGLAPDGALGLALLGAFAPRSCSRGSRSRFAAGRCCGSPPRPRPAARAVARAGCSLLGALAGYAFFTVLFWGTLYYHLRTGAPWTNFTRFWRLVLTNSDPPAATRSSRCRSWS